VGAEACIEVFNDFEKNDIPNNNTQLAWVFDVADEFRI
jgi:hypothetical protein